MIAAAVAMTGSGFVYAVGFVLCVAFGLNAWRRHRLRGGFPLPPGPIGLPLVGNIFDFDYVHPWLSYEQWGKKYGAIAYASLLGKDFIIINNTKVAHDLLDRRSTIYSERPRMPANEMFGVDFNSGLLPYGDEWRLHRKMYNSAFSKQRSSSYRPLAISKSRQLVENILEAPEEYAEHCRTFAGATIMAATYGYEVALKNDPFVTKIEYWIGLFIAALTPEQSALVFDLPLLAYVPSWLPGGKYKQRAAESRALAKEVLTDPLEFVIENMAAGTAKESVARDLLETQKGKVGEDTIKAVAASTFLGGAETSAITLRVFILAMVLYPEVQAKAQGEIDRVVGSGRLPDFDDRPSLPYIEAVYLETLRWRPVVPSAIPHTTTTSDVYEGMYIPKGATVITNIWGIGRDETQFDNSMAFVPERHLTSAGTLTESSAATHAFGFGRRICPGRHIADQNVWAAMVTMLATVHIAKARDELGNAIAVKEEFTSGLTSAPKPFACSITPRSSGAESLIRTKHEGEY